MTVSTEAMNSFFDERWFQEADRLVQRYAGRGSMKSTDLRAWEGSREYARAKVLFSFSMQRDAHFVELKAHMDSEKYRVLTEAPPNWPAFRSNRNMLLLFNEADVRTAPVPGTREVEAIDHLYGLVRLLVRYGVIIAVLVGLLAVAIVWWIIGLLLRRRNKSRVGRTVTALTSSR